MSHTLCYWVPAWFLLCLWSVSTRDFVFSSRTSQTNSTVPLEQWGYRHYFANDSLIGRSVPCTHEDKACFRHNLIFHPKFNLCLPTEYVGVNRTEFEQGSGRFLGNTESNEDPCTGYRMAYDGNCYEKEIVRDAICGREANITMHPFGAKECRVAQADPIFIEQPEEDGSCVIPDIRFPDSKRRVFYNNPLGEIQGFEQYYPETNYTIKLLKCGSAQVACFSEGKILVPQYEGCHTLLKRGPCAEDYIVALEHQAAFEGRAEGTCVHVRGGCPKGYKRMAFDGKCHEDREIVLEAPRNIMLNQFGNYIVTTFPVLHILLSEYRNACVSHLIIPFYPGLGAGEPVLSPPCGVNNQGNCKHHEVLNKPPMPIP